MYDVIVVGGGMSGAIAAIGAAREGAKTLIIEQYGFLGGMLTAAGVGPMMTFHAEKMLLVRGITDELIQRLVQKGKSPGHVFDTTGYTYTVTPFDTEALKTELETMAIEENVDILYHTMHADVKKTAGRIESVTVCNKAGLTDYSAAVYIDATGDADLSARAGVECRKGDPVTGKPQALSMMLRVNNVDTEACKAYIRDHDEEFPRLEHDTYKVYRAKQLSIGGFTLTVERARRDGAFTIPHKKDVLFFETNNPGEYVVNTSHLVDYDNLDPFSYSKAEVEGRRQANELFEMLKAYIPGFENARMMYTGPFLGIRSSRQIVGMYTLSDDDVYNSRRFEDAVAHSAYPVDVHHSEKTSYDLPPVKGNNHYEENRYYWGQIRSLPYRCMVNPVIDNLITVGRCVSVSFKAQGAFRTAPIVGAIGHAGGIAAALAAKQGVPARDLNIDRLHERIRAQGGYIQTK